MTIFLVVACFIGAILIVFQSVFEAVITPYILFPLFIFFIIILLYSLKDLKKYGLKLSKRTTKKEQLYAIINNLKCYHKIIDDNEKIDLIVLLETGVIAINILNIEGTIEVLEDGTLYYKKKGGQEGKINNFIEEINSYVGMLKEKVGISEVEKLLITNNKLLYKENFAVGFEIKEISRVYYDLEKRKEILYTKEEINRMYELIKDGSNKN